MELDKRIIEGKRPLTCFDLEEAKAFIGKECYLSNNMGCFSDLNCGVENKEIKKAELTNISNSAPCYEIPGFYYDFCLPCEWVKSEEPEKKYRAFSLNEFLERYKIGETVTFRFKKGEHVPEAECRVEYKRMITGYETLPENRDIPGKSSILLGGCPPISLARLFEFYELQNEYYFPTVWQPFGVIEDD